MIPRSYLFVPADRPDRIAKALASGADAVIVDLEDAVAPPAKDEARHALAAWLRAAGAGPQVVVRVNGADTAWFSADLATCAAPAVRAVMLPKAGQPGDVAAVHQALPGKPIIALIETAEGFDLGMVGDGEELIFFRSRFVLESRLARLAPPVDGITTAIDDAALVARDAQSARRLGFGAKLCIDPQQVEAVNCGFTPTATKSTGLGAC